MSGEILCVIPGPRCEYLREPAGDRWCFGCRRRLPHDWILLGDPPEELSYYEPQWYRKCSRCGKDRTLFPSREGYYGDD